MCAITSFWLEGKVEHVTVEPITLKRFTPLNHPIYSERVDLMFHLQADLRPLFHWNVKQVFVYVIAEYVTDTHDINQVVIWDKIVRTDCAAINDNLPHLDTWCPEDARFVGGEKLYNKYHLLHPQKQLKYVSRLSTNRTSLCS